MPGTTKRAGASKVNKSAWIRALPTTMAAKDVVDKAKAQGIKLSIAQVYTTRSVAKKKGGVGGGTKRVSAKPARASRRSTGGGGDDQLAFRRLVLSIGLPKAEAYLSDLRRSVGL
jgi:hypothetical protein